MILLATLPSHSHNDCAGFNSPAEIGLSVTKADTPLKSGFFSSANSVPRFGGAWRGRIYARQSLRLVDQPCHALPPLIGLNGVGYLTPTKSAHTMSTITATRHIHKTLSYLSPEKYAALRHPMPFKRLPFVHVGKLHVNSYWAVPAKGEYFGGYEVGKAMAKAFLKHLANNGESLDAYMLTSIIQSQSDRLQDAIERHQCQGVAVKNWPTEPASLRGQQAGFINTIGEMLLATTKLLSPAFDGVDEQSITQHANHALTRTDAQVRELAKRVDLQAAKEGRQ